MIRVIKLHPDAVLPTRANDDDFCFDLTAISKKKVYDQSGEELLYIEYGTGLAFEPTKFKADRRAILIFPRSSIRNKKLILCNSVGVVDQGYQGEVMVCFKPSSDNTDGYEYEIGDKVAQAGLFVQDRFELITADTFFYQSTRGDKGHGSSGA